MTVVSGQGSQHESAVSLCWPVHRNCIKTQLSRTYADIFKYSQVKIIVVGGVIVVGVIVGGYSKGYSSGCYSKGYRGL